MLIDGKSAFPQSSRLFRDQELSGKKQRGFTPQQISVAINGLAAAINPSINVRGITINQL